MEANDMPPVTQAGTSPAPRSGIRSWILALVLGAVLVVAGAASVFAASAPADPGASPATTSSQGTDSTDKTADDGPNCPERSGSDSSQSDNSAT